MRAEFGYVIRCDDGRFFRELDHDQDTTSTVRWASHPDDAVIFFDEASAKKVSLDCETSVVAFDTVMNEPKSIGRVAFETGRPVYEWDDLEAAERQRWETAADAAVNHWLANDGRKFQR